MFFFILMLYVTFGYFVSLFADWFKGSLWSTGYKPYISITMTVEWM